MLGQECKSSGELQREMLASEDTGRGRWRRCWGKVVSVILIWKPLVGEAVPHCPTWPWPLIAWSFSLEICISGGLFLVCFCNCTCIWGQLHTFVFLPLLLDCKFHLPFTPKTGLCVLCRGSSTLCAKGLGKGVGGKEAEGRGCSLA